MVIDGFIFYNELDMLEFRLEELDSCVDYFVLVEATLTHSGIPKALYFQDNKARFKKFLSKIIHVVIDDIPEVFDPIHEINRQHPIKYVDFQNYILEMLKYPKPPYTKFWDLHINRQLNIHEFNKNAQWQSWVREWLHRQGILRGINSLNPIDSDVVLISDIDEIPEANLVSIIAHNGPDGHSRIGFKNSINGLYGFLQHMYYCNLECRAGAYWYRPKVMNYGTLRDIGDSDAVRLAEGGACLNSFYGGWHFSYFGGVDQIIKKVQGFSHQEYNSPQVLDVALLHQRIENHVDVLGRDDGEPGRMWNYTPFYSKDYWPTRVDLLLELFKLPYTFD